MKKRSAVMITLLLVLFAAVSLAAEEAADGIYRGFYYDGGIEQLAVQFEIKDGIFQSFVYRGIRYKDGDYMSRDASDAQKAAVAQFDQLADHLIGKGVEAIDDLYTPYDFVEDVDSVTSATIQSSKLISAVWDGLTRRPYKLVDTSKLPQADPAADGVYRGQYMENGGEEVTLEFVVRDGCFVETHYTALSYGGVDYLADGADTKAVREQFEALIAYLIDKPISAVNSLYQPGDIVADVDGFSGATLRSPKVISAIWDGLSRHVYRLDR